MILLLPGNSFSSLPREHFHRR